ncbi:MAG: NUDIX domain-containing protein [Pirellulales bacterium]|nr:NUDIX domain-containing protein [Pirellulales bacterium]
MNDYVKTMRELIGPRPMLLPGARALIVNSRGEILLQRRTDVPIWCLPSGSMELGETALDALRREVAEETSLVVLEAEPMGLYSGPSQTITYPNGDEIQCFSIAFIVRRWEGEPRADGVEGSEVRFFPLDNLPSDLTAIHAKTIEDYKNYRGEFMLC